MFTNLPDIVICDMVMPDFDGLKFLKLKRSRQEFDKIPVLILTSMDNLNDKIRALAEGAQDYVTKPFSPPELVARVKAHLRIKMLQDELIAAKEKLELLSANTHSRIKLMQDELTAANEKLEAVSHIDQLTGLYGRRSFVSALEREFARAKEYNRVLSLIMIDMDNFKSVNDTCGPLAGEKVLSVVAGIFKTGLKKVDVCSRYGGQEFAVMLAETGEKEAVLLAEGYMNEIRKQDLSDICGETPITFSIGIACLPDDSIGNINEFLKRAGEALNESKSAGRNRITVYAGHAGQ
jgi:diguanylate cyclase (GGDEF)-like protein